MIESRSWLTRLTPRGAAGLDTAAMDAAAALAVRDVVGRLGEDPALWAVELAREVVEDIIAAVPQLGGSRAAFEVLRRGNEVTTLNALLALSGAGATAEASPLPIWRPTLDGVRQFVHRAIPLDRMLHGVRVGQAATTAAFQQACVQLCAAEVLGEELPAITRELFGYVDELSGAMISEYLAEHDVWTASAAAARAEVVRSVLSGASAVDPASASRRLGYELRGTHLAAVLWSDVPDDESALQSTAAALLAERGATATLVVPAGAGRVWAWGCARRRFTAGPARTGTVPHGGTAFVVAVGMPADGVAGFRRSHQEAERAAVHEGRRRAGGCPARAISDHADVAALALLSADLPSARAFVHRELGPLAEPGAAMEALRITLRHYLDTDRGLAASATRLQVARGTVTYRVRRAEQLLGRPVEQRRFALTAALELAVELGTSVLGPDGAS